MLEKLKNKKILLAIVIIVALLIAIPLTIMQVQKFQENRSHAATGEVAVILDANETIHVGDIFPVYVDLNTEGNDVSAVDTTFTYDSNLVEVATPSAPLGTDEVGSHLTTIINSSTTPGEIHYVGVNPSSTSLSAYNGFTMIPLGKLYFKAKVAGNGTIGFSNIHVNAAGIAGALPVDTVNTKEGAYIIGGSDISPTGASCTTSNDCPSGQICQTGPQRFCRQSGPVPTDALAMCNSCLSQGKKYICAGYVAVGPGGNTSPWACDTDGTAVMGVDSGTSCYVCPADLTPTPTPGGTSVMVYLSQTGIGANGGGENNNPQNPTRVVSLKLWDVANNQQPIASGDATYQSTSGLFVGTIPVNVPDGNYTAAVRLSNTLYKKIPGIISIVNGQTAQTQPVSLVSGDFNGDNEINLQDYNALISASKYQ